MSSLFVEQKVEPEKIKEEKIKVNVNKILYKAHKNIKKERIKNPSKRIDYLCVDKNDLPQNLPNAKNIKNRKLKNQLNKDVKLAILSSKKILANTKFMPLKEGYIKYNSMNEPGVHNASSSKKKKKKKKGQLINSTEMETQNNDDNNMSGINDINDINSINSCNRNDLDFNTHKNYTVEQDGMNSLGPEDEEGNINRRASQKYIYDKADVGTQKKVFDLKLNMGPYSCTYTRNGKYLLMTGVKGHVSLIDTHNLESLCEYQVDEMIRCNTTLHNYKLFAVSQKKYIYIYDNTGMEINCIKDILYTYNMVFLPYHFLLTSIGEFGELVYQDISVGNIITRKKTKRGPCSIIKQNKKDAIIYLGHKNGHVTLWSPNVDKCLCDIFCHHTPISSIGVHDNYLITASVDSTYKLWDIRKMEYIKSYKSHNIINNIDISDTSLVAFSMNTHFRTYNNFFTNPQLYITHNVYGDQINSISFQPFEDICSLGLKHSIKTVLVPGAGIANIDTFFNNPYETKKQVRENEVKLLLDKLPADTIKFNTNQIGNLNPYILKHNEQKNYTNSFNKKNIKKGNNNNSFYNNKKKANKKKKNKINKKNINVMDKQSEQETD
ncbi:nucleolar rRNA processing protein, putative [Plasmodium sp. DRC-Itaito]|nr:nucleolar rRNA processing protein, putative [Plasmodium sp. DRC-Itaito]